MGKRGKVINPKSFSRNRGVASDDMDDEIDAFHKQRDIIPLDANGDIVDSDDEIPVFDLKWLGHINIYGKNLVESKMLCLKKMKKMRKNKSLYGVEKRRNIIMVIILITRHNQVMMTDL